MTDLPPTHRGSVISERSLISWGAFVVFAAVIFGGGLLWADVQNLKREVVELRSIVLSDRAGISFAVGEALRRLGPNDWTARGVPRVAAVNRVLAAMQIERRATGNDVARVWLGLSQAERSRLRGDADGS